jgi:hypothetical protein
MSAWTPGTRARRLARVVLATAVLVALTTRGMTPPGPVRAATAWVLSVDLFGNGSGTWATTDTSGAIDHVIVCNLIDGVVDDISTCSANYPLGTTVYWLMNPNPGNAECSDQCTTSVSRSSITLNNDYTASAIFERLWHVSFSLTGNGSGSVKTTNSTFTTNDGRIDCSISGGVITPGSKCAHDYLPNGEFQIYLDIRTSTGTCASFNLHPPACSGTLANQFVSSDAAFTIDYQLQPETLTLTPPTHGTVVSSKGPFNCGEFGCTQSLLYGTKVTLTAAADPGYVFDHWGGDCSGVLTKCTLTMTADRAASAAFALAPAITPAPRSTAHTTPPPTHPPGVTPPPSSLPGGATGSPVAPGGSGDAGASSGPPAAAGETMQPGASTAAESPTASGTLPTGVPGPPGVPGSESSGLILILLAVILVLVGGIGFIAFRAGQARGGRGPAATRQPDDGEPPLR